MKLMLIPAGDFEMGSPASDQDAFPHEKPQHRVRITRPFYMGVHEVTQGQYRAVTGEDPSHFKGSDDLPVESVSWDDAITFCNKLSELEGLKPCYQSGAAQSGGNGYRLPTEAEWEYACRAGSETRFGFGETAARRGEFAWCRATRMARPIRSVRSCRMPGACTTCPAMSASGAGIGMGTIPTESRRPPTRSARRGAPPECSEAWAVTPSRGVAGRHIGPRVPPSPNKKT